MTVSEKMRMSKQKLMASLNLHKTYVKDAFPFLSSFERFQTKFFQKSGSKEFFSLSVGVPENVKCDAYLKFVENVF